MITSNDVYAAGLRIGRLLNEARVDTRTAIAICDTIRELEERAMKAEANPGKWEALRQWALSMKNLLKTSGVRNPAQEQVVNALLHRMNRADAGDPDAFTLPEGIEL